MIGPHVHMGPIKKSEFPHYSNLGPVVRNAKFCYGPTAYCRTKYNDHGTDDHDHKQQSQTK